jgi:hypothetical protein
VNRQWPKKQTESPKIIENIYGTTLKDLTCQQGTCLARILRQYEKCLDFRRSGMDSCQTILPDALRVNANLFQTDLCRNPETKDGFHSLHPCILVTGNPCRYDTVRAWRKTLANQEKEYVSSIITIKISQASVVYSLFMQ